MRAEQIISEVGANSCSAKEEFLPDGVQDPYRAVDESDAIVWVECPEPSLKRGDYNVLYGDSVMQRALQSGKPILYYQTTKTGSLGDHSQLLQGLSSRRSAEGLSEVEILCGRI